MAHYLQLGVFSSSHLRKNCVCAWATCTSGGGGLWLYNIYIYKYMLYNIIIYDYKHETIQEPKSENILVAPLVPQK